MRPAYETDGATIYRRSFSIIRAEAELARFSAEEEPVAVRMIHAAGLVALAGDIRFSPGFATAARTALAAGAPILCDAEMVARAAESLDLDDLDLLIIENVGNLVCPASYDLGESLRVVLLSVTEGEDKPLKYPAAFQSASSVR